MILPRQRIVKPFQLWRVESTLRSLSKPVLPMFLPIKTYKEKVKIAEKAGWLKRAKRLANEL